MAKIFVILFWIVTAINFYDSLPSGAKYFFCLFPNAGLLFAFQIIFQYERSGMKSLFYCIMTWKVKFNLVIFKGESLGFPQLYKNLYNDPLNLGVILLIMIIWTVVYIPVTWYIERIFPGDYGAPLPFYFPFMVCLRSLLDSVLAYYLFFFFLYKAFLLAWSESNWSSECRV